MRTNQITLSSSGFGDGDFSLRDDLSENAICRRHLENLFGKLGAMITIEFSMEPFEGAREIKFVYRLPEHKELNWISYVDENPDYYKFGCGRLYEYENVKGYVVSLYEWLEDHLLGMFKKAKVDRFKPISLFVALVEKGEV